MNTKRKIKPGSKLVKKLKYFQPIVLSINLASKRQLVSVKRIVIGFFISRRVLSFIIYMSFFISGLKSTEMSRMTLYETRCQAISHKRLCKNVRR